MSSSISLIRWKRGRRPVILTGSGAITYTVTGPSSGLVGVASTTITVTPSATVTDTVTISLSGTPAGSLSATTLAWTASAAAQTLTYTPSLLGVETISFWSGASYAINGSPVTYTVTQLSMFPAPRPLARFIAFRRGKVWFPKPTFPQAFAFVSPLVPVTRVQRVPRQRWRPIGGGLAPAGGGGSPTPGTATVGRIGIHSIGVSATAPTGGSSPYAYQWQWNWQRGGATWVNATGPGVTTLAATISNLGPSASYHLRLKITDSASNVVYTTVVTAYTLPLRWHPQLRRPRPR